MRTNKFAVAGTLLLAATTLVGCGGSNSSSGGDSGAGSDGGAAGRGVSLALVQGVKNEPFYISMACGAKQQAQKMGVDLSVQAPNQWDVQQQTQVVNAVAAKNPDGVLVAPVHETSMAAPIKQLAQRGSKVVLVDTSLKDSSFAVTHISSNNKLGGRTAAKEMAKLTNKKGTVLVVSVTPGTPTTGARAKGFSQEIKQNYPDMKVLPVQYSGDDAAKAASIVQSTLSAHPDLAGVFAANLVTGQGTTTGLRNAGKVGEVKVVEFDASPTQVRDLKKGSAQALIAQKPLEIGKKGITKAVAAVNGSATSVSSELSTGVVTVTKKNLDDPDVSKYLYKKSC